MSEQRARKPIRTRKTPPNPRLRNRVRKPAHMSRRRISASSAQRPPSAFLSGLWPKIKATCRTVKEKHLNAAIAIVLAIAVLIPFFVGLGGGATKPASVPVVPNGIITATFDNISYTFSLKGLEQFSEAEIKEYLTLTPNIAFTVKKLEDGKALITPTQRRNITYSGSFTYPDQSGDSKTSTFTVNKYPLTVSLEELSVHEYQYVTLKFSEQVDIYSLEQNLRIDPQVDFTLSHDGSRATIMPDGGWLYAGQYKVTIGQGYKSANGKQFGEAQEFTFTIRDSEHLQRVNPHIAFNTAGDFMLNPSDPMTMTFTASKLPQNVPVVIDTYRMPSIERYREQGSIYLDYSITATSLEKLDSNVFLIQNNPAEKSKDYESGYVDTTNRFTVPNPGAGAYILSATYTDPHTKEEKTVRTSYLVSAVSVYMQTSERETAVWINSSERNAPLSGYEITVDGMDEPAGKTDTNGLLLIPNEKLPELTDFWESKMPFSITDPDGNLVYYDSTNQYASREHGEHYYSYLFLDRALYKPEDTVCFWGFVSPYRTNTTELPKTAFVRFDPDGLDITVEAEIAPSGIFSGEIALEKIKSTQYAVSAELRFPQPDAEEGAEVVEAAQANEYGEYIEDKSVRVLETEYVSVKEFEKPTFVLSATTDKDYYAGDDQVRVTASASFYDGTPLPNYPLEIAYYDTSTYNWVSLPAITTDSNGNASFSFPAVNGKDYFSSYYSLRSNNYKIQIASDGEQVTKVGNYNYFPSDILTEASFEEKDGNVSMTVRAYEFDVSSPALKEYMERVKTDLRYWRWFDSRELIKVAKGAPVDVELNLDLRWNYIDQNRITHRNNSIYSEDNYVPYRNSYSLDREEPFQIIDDWETQLKRIKVETQDGVAIIDGLIHVRDGNTIDFSRPVHISASLGYTDKKQSEYYDYFYYTNTDDYDYWNRQSDEDDEIVKGYSFAVTNVTTGEDITPKYYDSNIPVHTEETLKFDLLLDGVPVETNGKLFYSLIQDGMYEYSFTGNSFSIPYKMAYGREIHLVAAYFDGEKTRYVKQLDLRATDESLAVNIEVTPDKTGYRPGDDVVLTVKATDYMGRGVSGNLCVSVVDEAVFALAEQEVDALYGIYKLFYSFNNSVRQYCTTYRNESEPANPVDGGKGGEGGVEFYDSYRSKFKDTALFLPTRTDSGGNSRVTFTLPDNTTSWRITAVEIGDDLRAGQLKTNILSSLPFFVKPVMTSKYIEGDEISMLVQGHGTLLDDGDDISYIVTVKGDGTDVTLTAEGKTGEPLEFNFGKLPIGSYTVISRAQYSGFSDTVELPLDVIKSNLELVISKPIDPQKKLDIDAVRYPVTLTFYDKENEAFFASINSLFGHYCMQANQRLSRFVAKRVVRDSVTDGQVPSYIAEGNDSASDMQNDDGGIAFYPGDASEPLVTTYVLLVAKDQFNLPLMAQYYRDVLATEADVKIRAACWLGLAAIGDATEAEIMAEFGVVSRLDAQAYLIAALAYLDKTELATEYYNQILSPMVAGINPDVRQSELYERNVAAIWIAASRLHHPDADALSLYFGGTHWRYRTLFECMIYVTNYNRQVTPMAFSYNVKGERKERNLGLSGMSTLVLSKSELESFEIIDAPESLSATAYYVGEPSEFGLEQSDNMSVSKSIRAIDDSTYEVSLKIDLAKDAPTGYYDISDWVPSNTRLYSYDSSVSWGRDTIYFDTETEGQKLYLSFNHKVQEARALVFRYQVRQTYTGTAVLDTVYMIHGDSGNNCHTEKAEFAPTALSGRRPAIKTVQ